MARVIIYHETMKDSDIRSYDNGALIFNDLGSGRIDAVIISHFGGMKYAKVNHRKFSS